MLQHFKFLFSIVFILAAVAFSFDISVEFHPFKVHFNNLMPAIGFLLALIGLIIMSVSEYDKGLKFGNKLGRTVGYYEGRLDEHITYVKDLDSILSSTDNVHEFTMKLNKLNYDHAKVLEELQKKSTSSIK